MHRPEELVIKILYFRKIPQKKKKKKGKKKEKEKKPGPSLLGRHPHTTFRAPFKSTKPILCLK